MLYVYVDASLVMYCTYVQCIVWSDVKEARVCHTDDFSFVILDDRVNTASFVRQKDFVFSFFFLRC
jgi:hypothetical protein